MENEQGYFIHYKVTPTLQETFNKMSFKRTELVCNSFYFSVRNFFQEIISQFLVFSNCALIVYLKFTCMDINKVCFDLK